jgi:hypothetical protein
MEALREKDYRIIPGDQYGTPKEVWGFRSRPTRGRPREVARRFLGANADLLGLVGIHPTLQVQRVVESLGAQHVILQQCYERVRVYRAYVTVHIGADHRVYLIKNRAVPKRFLAERGRFELGREAARDRALRTLRSKRDVVEVLDVARRWFPRGDEILPAYRVRLHRERPREEWLVYVNAHTGGILHRYENLANVGGSARVFDPNPVVALGDWRRLVGPNGGIRRPPEEAYATVRLRDLDGTGRLDGRRVTTKPTPDRARREDHRFHFESTEPGFVEAMAYFHVDRALRYLESLGYRGRRAIFSEPLAINANGTEQDNSWYSPGMRSLTFGRGGVDDPEDAEIILHELGHAVQDAICPDFGQSAQAAAMGEGFGDYFAASFFADRKPPMERSLVMGWDAIADEERRPPYLRRLDERLTFESFDASSDADEHDNGRIWAATLWDVWTALGRAVADRIIVESHFQLDGFTTFARGARAILDADRNLYRGRHVARLVRIFHDRGIAPVQ